MKISSRFDGRIDEQIRALSSNQGVLNRADGSVQFSAGNTSILVAIYGPAQAMQSKKEKPDRALIEVCWKSEKGPQSCVEIEREIYIRRTLEEAVVVTSYPRSIISIIIQVLCDDGSILSTAINACTIALVDAGIEMISLPLATTVSLHETEAQRLQLDPCQYEEEKSRGTVMLVTLSGMEGVVALKVSGILSSEELFACAEAARKACSSVGVYLRKAIEAKVMREASNFK